MKTNLIGEDNICPVTKLYCDDETCMPGGTCNLSGIEEGTNDILSGTCACGQNPEDSKCCKKE